MKFEDLTPGTVLRRKTEPAWTNEFSKVKVIETYRGEDYEYVWVRYIKKDGAVKEFDTLTYLRIKADWEIVPPFFEIGKKYTPRDGVLGVTKGTYEIMDIYQVDNPYNADSAVTAIAKLTWEDGTQAILPLGATDYARITG